MVRNSSTKYRQLLSVERLSEQGGLSLYPCELRSQLRRWRYFVDRISSMFRSFKKLYLAACLPLSPPPFRLLEPFNGTYPDYMRGKNIFQTYKLIFISLKSSYIPPSSPLKSLSSSAARGSMAFFASLKLFVCAPTSISIERSLKSRLY